MNTEEQRECVWGSVGEPTTVPWSHSARGQNHPQTIPGIIYQATFRYAIIRNAKLLTDQGLCNDPCGTQFRYLHLL